MIPLISSICNGPLDVCHLPRFWWKEERVRSEPRSPSAFMTSGEWRNNLSTFVRRFESAKR